MSLKNPTKGMPIEQYRKSLAQREIHVPKQVTDENQIQYMR
jgi:hypothetical protein